jgi:hypothetical protein
MTNASAMLLVFVVFLAMFIGAMIVILWGGGLFRHRPTMRHHDDMNHDHRAAA